MAHGATPRSLCERYNDECYESLRDDERRTASYIAAIKAAADGKVCLDIGTGSLALLAIAAARAGAKHVYAVEANKKSAADARQIVAEAELSNLITVLDGFSTDVRLPEPVELLMHEIIGEVAGAEGVYAAIADARLRHCSAAARIASVPARAISLLSPAEWPTGDYFASQPVPLLAPPDSRALLMPALPHALRLAPPQVFEEMRFDGDNNGSGGLGGGDSEGSSASQARALEFVCSRDATLSGLLIWIEIFMTSGESGAKPDISSAEPSGSSWSNVYLMLPEPLLVEQGDAISVQSLAQLAGPQPTYRFEVSHQGRLLGTLCYPEDPPPDESAQWTEDECMVEFW